VSERSPNYYEVLDVHPLAKSHVIEAAYKKLRKKHPDHGFDAEAYKKITAARAVLLDAEKRAKHDEALRQAGFIFPGEEPSISPEARIIRNANAPSWGYPTPASNYDDFINVEVDLDEDDSFRRRPFVEVAIRLLGALFWLGAAAGCYFVAPYITKPFQDVTSFGGDMVALVAGIFRLVVYLGIPACVIMGGYTLFHRRNG
jgi:curved DNA-binding protein CbpA